MFHRLIYWILLFPFAIVFRCLFPFRVRGIENIPRQGGVILAGNHTGWLDSVIIAVACPRPVTFIAKKRFFGWVPLGWLMKATRQIPWEPGSWPKTMATGVARLHEDGVVCIFPEGRVTYTGEMGRFRRGVIQLQESSGSPLVPFCIHGGFEAWSCDRKYPRRRPICIEFATAEKQVKLEQLGHKVAGMKRQLETLDFEGRVR